MKKLLLIITLFLFSILTQAQTDFDIVKLIIGNNISTVDTVLSHFDLEYYITLNEKTDMELYIVKNNSVRIWKIKFSDIYTFGDNSRKNKSMIGENLIYEIFVRYRHSNLNDLREFFSYEVPKSTKYMTYEKEHGTVLSHLRVIHGGYSKIVDNY